MYDFFFNIKVLFLAELELHMLFCLSQWKKLDSFSTNIDFYFIHIEGQYQCIISLNSMNKCFIPLLLFSDTL